MTAHRRPPRVATVEEEMRYGQPLGSIIGRDRHKDLPERWRKYTAAEIVRADLIGVAFNDLSRYTRPQLLSRAEATLGSVAARRGVDADIIHRESNKAVVQHVEQSRLEVRVRANDLASVLADGHFKTLHQTAGGPQANVRAHLEQVWFGDLRKHPVYGAFVRGDAPTFPVERAHDRLSMYGRIAVVLSLDAEERSTFIVGDSLAIAREAQAIPNTNHVGNPVAWARARQKDMAYPEYLAHGGERYVEAQVHGGITVDHIDHIRVDSYIGGEAYTRVMSIVRGAVPVLGFEQQ